MQQNERPGGDDNAAITIVRRLDKAPEAVWAAVTESEHIADWWGDYVSLEARPGGAFREVWRDESGREVITAGKVEAFDPPHRLSLSWKDADWPVETRVTIRIDDDGNGTVLTLVHEGWNCFGADGVALRRAHEAGWRHHLDSLAALLGTSPG